MKIRSLKQLLLIIMRSVLAWKTPLNLENLEMLNIEAVVVKATCVTCASLWDSQGLGGLVVMAAAGPALMLGDPLLVSKDAHYTRW